MMMNKKKTGITENKEMGELEYVSNDNEESIATQLDADSIKRPERLHLENVLGIGELELELSPNINVILGENSTGKTAILKTLYFVIAGYLEGKNLTTKEMQKSCLEQKMKNIFRPNGLGIGNIIKKGSNDASIEVFFQNYEYISMVVRREAYEQIELYVNMKDMPCNRIVYIPPKEMASVDGFVSVYENYKISFEEMYYDISKKLLMPQKRKMSERECKIVSDLTQVVGGSTKLSDGKLFLTDFDGNDLEMGLASEGYRKVITLIHLVLNGNLRSGDILIWDEPETNMNPKMTEKIVKSLISLAENGIQIFIATHDYFVAQEFALDAKYGEKSLKYHFFSLYKENDEISVEFNDDLHELEHNAIMEQFDDLYTRENSLKWKEIQN